MGVIFKIMQVEISCVIFMST